MYSNALLQGILAVIIFGTLPVSIRFVNVDPFTMGIFRLVMGIVLMLPFAVKQKLNIKRADWKILF